MNTAVATTDTTLPPFILAASLPAIGAPLLDGKFAGVSLEGSRLVALVLLDGDEELPHAEAVAFAAKRGAVLPSRHDGLVLFDNLRGEFKPEWYWTGQEVAGSAVYAWLQSFDDGYQYRYLKSYDYRCRAVRRVPIQ